MNILLLTTHLNFGGIASYVFSLARGLKEKGHRVIVSSSGGEYVKKLTLEGIEHFRIPISTKCEISPKVFISSLMLLSLIRKEKIQIIHAHSRVTQVLSCGLSFFSRVPFISTCHGFFRLRSSRRLFPCWGIKVIAISEAVEGHLIYDFGLDKKDVALIHNGIDIKKFKIQNSKSKIQMKKEIGLEDAPVVGILGRLSVVKGHRFLILAMKEVISRIPQARLLIVGDGRIRDELIDLVKKSGILKNTLFLPSIMDTAKVLSAMDIFVMPSLDEGLGLSIMEAEACGLAVIASNVGGISSLVKDGLNGILVPKEDVYSLREAILRLLKDRELAKRMGEKGRRLIEERFSLEGMVSKTEGVYNSVVKKGTGNFL